MRHHHKGGALISALFITAIAAMIATALAMQQRLLIHESELILHSDQGYLNCQIMQAAAKTEVAKYALQFNGQANTALRLFPLPVKLTPLKMNGMILRASLDDEQGKFNLNNLVFKDNQPQFIVLLRAVMPSISEEQAVAIAKATTHWMTTGVDDPAYLQGNPAYRSSKIMMANSRELRLILGVTPKIYSALSPYITALPIPFKTSSVNASVAPVQAQGTQININSVSAPVLLTTGSNLTMSQVKKLLVCRDHLGVINNLQEFMSQCAEPAGISTLNNLTSRSTYFSVKTQAQYKDHEVILNSLLVTEPAKNNTLNVITVWQEFE